MKRLIVLLVLGAAWLLPAGSAQAASYHRCQVGKYLVPAPSPEVSGLRIKMAKAKADGYAPRCLVADAVASLVQDGYRAKRGFPKRVTAMGARWYVGRFTCTYERVGAEGSYAGTCKHKGKDAATVRLRLAV